MDRYILDTHALIWYLEGNPRLGSRAKAIIDDPSNELVLPIIALAEAVFVVERGKTGIPDVQTLIERVDGDPRILIYPLDRSILDRTLTMQSIPEMHDRQIAATALVLTDEEHTALLVTKDSVLTDSPDVTTVW